MDTLFIVFLNISRLTRKPTLLTLRNVSTQPAQANPGRHIPSQGDRVMIPETENPQEEKIVCPG